MESGHFTAPRTISGDGLVIRTYRAEDAQALCAATVASYQHLSRYMPWANTTQTIEETEAIIQSFSSEYADAKNFVVGIWREGDGALLGGTGFHRREGPIHYASARSGCGLPRPMQVKGLGSVHSSKCCVGDLPNGHGSV